MRKTLITLLLAALPVVAQTTNTVRLVWDLNPAGENVKEYRVYHALNQTNKWELVARTNTPPVTVPVLRGTNYWRCTAWNGLESEPSNTVSIQPPGVVNGMRIVVTLEVGK
jgi:hypothetical protein